MFLPLPLPLRPGVPNKLLVSNTFWPELRFAPLFMNGLLPAVAAPPKPTAGGPPKAELTCEAPNEVLPGCGAPKEEGAFRKGLTGAVVDEGGCWKKGEG